ncbi:RNA 2',3'-cyclic phosphodiesterase [Alteromonas flava]|uniref:RNA 2',3'-cyclic phosphodiesterase n=1 Tax=Alteromonas flava TaxID=2048003 RepID=UPI0013DB4A83|nr:RNA 2',3'-cyclic phosphodiesterase [Alteromonas flava]
MRCFIGIDLSALNKRAIEQWASANWPEITSSKPVPASNYHLTLLFIGQVNQAQQEQLITCVDKLIMRPFQVRLNQTGCWHKPPIAYLTDKHPEQVLLELQSNIEATIKELVVPDLHTHSAYRPHVTLARKFRHVAPQPKDNFSFAQEVTHIHLFESVSGPHGVSYPIRHSWPLG